MARPGPEPSEKNFSCARLQPAYWLPRHARMGLVEWTDNCHGQCAKDGFECRETRPRPPMQISVINRPASKPPGNLMPASMIVAPVGCFSTPSRRLLALATRLATNGAVSVLTLGQ